MARQRQRASRESRKALIKIDLLHGFPVRFRPDGLTARTIL